MVYLLLLVLLVMLVGFACACFVDHPMQAVERALTALSNPAPLVEVWSPLIALLLALPLVSVAHARPRAGLACSAAALPLLSS